MVGTQDWEVMGMMKRGGCDHGGLDKAWKGGHQPLLDVLLP